MFIELERIFPQLVITNFISQVSLMLLNKKLYFDLDNAWMIKLLQFLLFISRNTYICGLKCFQKEKEHMTSCKLFCRDVKLWTDSLAVLSFDLWVASTFLHPISWIQYANWPEMKSFFVLISWYKGVGDDFIFEAGTKDVAMPFWPAPLTKPNSVKRRSIRVI